MGSPGDFSNANIGPLPRREVKRMKFRHSSVDAVYLSSNGLGNQAFDAASQGSVTAGLSTGVTLA